MASEGGGVYNDGALSLLFSTITRNQGSNDGGVFNNVSTTATWNTMIAGNLASSDGINPDVSGNFISNSLNITDKNQRTSIYGFLI